MALRENQGFYFKYIEFKMLISQSTGEMKLAGMIEPGSSENRSVRDEKWIDGIKMLLKELIESTLGECKWRERA